ncbi:MAG TPA: SHOCT domain-containing protein [Acidimicrobiia bacterium]|nr:SHOCT domain-containing protein [Acidimicrobiia bacterium]
MMDGGGGFWMWGGSLVLLALIALVVVVVMHQQGDQHDRSQSGSTSSAGEILDERFARGEIDEDEYRKRRSALRN